MKMKRLLAVLLSASMLLGNNSLVFAEEDFAEEVIASQSDSYNEADHLDVSVSKVSVIETEAETAADESESYISLETEDASLSDVPSDSDAEKDTERPETAEPLVLEVIEIEVESLEEESLEDQFSGTEAETASEAASEEEEYPDEFYLEEEIILEDINLETESFTNELPEETELETEDGIEAEEDEFAASEDLVYGDFTYRISGENAQITGYTGSASHLAIPDSIAGYAVVSIGNYAFDGCEQITSVNLPEGLISIGYHSFSDTKITYVKIPSSVTALGTSFTSGSVTSAFQYCKDLEIVEFADGIERIPKYSLCNNSSIKKVIIPDSAQTVGEKAFYRCTGLQSVIFGRDVESIASYAFSGCTGLSSIIFNEALETISSYAFNGCTELNSIVFSSSLQVIGQGAFSGCEQITELNFPNGLRSIGHSAFSSTLINYIKIPSTVVSLGTSFTSGSVASAFQNCENLETVEFAEGMEQIPDFSLCNNTSVKEIIFPDTVQTIGKSAFHGCTGLKNIVIPDYVQTLREKAFYRCTGLQSVIFGRDVKSIGSYAFSGCTGLSSIIFNEALETISSYAFNGCTELNSIVFSSSLQAIGQGAFSGCEQITELNFPNGLRSIGHNAFSSTLINYIKIPSTVVSLGTSFTSGSVASAFQGCENLETVEFAEGIERIPKCSLCNNSSIKKVIIPDSAQTVGEKAFYRCTGLQSVIFGRDVDSIASYAFSGCTGLSSIIFNEALETISSYAFNGCTELNSIVFSSSLQAIGQGAFSGCEQITELNFPNGLRSIGHSAFSSTLINYIKIPSTVVSLGTSFTSGSVASAFQNCENLETVEFADGMETVPAYSLAGNTAVKNIIFPDTLQTIGKSAFYGCTSLAAVTILEPTSSKALPVVTGVTGAEVEDEDEDVHTLEIKWALGEGEKFRIQSSAFANCASLTRIDFPSNLGNIESNAFSGCTVMNELYYPGSAEDWTKISIGSGNENITSATKYFGNEVLNQITGCQVQLCTDEDFVGAQVVRVPYESEESLSTVIEAKEKVKTYYIRIRTYRNKETEEGLVSSLGVWSDTSTLTVYNPVTANDVKKSVEAFYASMEDYFKDLKKEAKADSKNYQNNSTTSGKVLMETDLAAKDRLITFIPGVKLSNRQQEDIYTVFAGYISQVTDLEIEKISVMSNRRLESYAIKIMKTVADNLTANSDPYVQKTSSGVVAFVPMQAIGGAFTGTVKLNNRQVAVYTSGAKGTVGVMVDYLNNLKEVFADLMYQVLASYFSDLASFTGLTDFMNSEVEDWFKQLDSDLQNALANELLKAGYGNLKKILVGAQTGYKIILDVKNAVTKPELETVLKNADDIYKTIDKLDLSDNSVNKQLLGAATKELENQRSDLAKMLYAYIYGTEKGEPVSTGAKLLKKLNMNCPVDFIVYGADGNILGSVRNGAASFLPQITILVNGSTKEVWIDGTKNYTIEFIGTGTGTMNYTIQDRKGRKVVNQMDYFGVPLEEGIVYRQNISAGSFAQTSDRMPLISDTSSISSSDHFDMEGNAEYVTVTCEAAAGGRIDETSQTGEIEKGTAICVKAVPDEGYRFTGWYLGEDLKETDETYYFAAVEDVALQARFKKKVVYNHDYGSIPGKDYSDSVQIFLVKDNGEDPQSGEQLILYLDKGTEELAVTLKKYITENGEPETEAAKLIREDVYKYVLQPFSPEGYVKIEIWDENGVLIATILTKDLMPEDSCGDGNHDNDILEERAATCTTDGFRRTRCFLCEKEETVILPAAGHNWDGGRITAQPTCTAAGQKMFTCSVCGSTRTEAISPAGHKYITETVKATVTADGAVITKCSVCGETAQSSAVYYPKTITLSRTSYTYDKRVKEPEVVVTGSDGTVIPVSNYTVQYDGGRKKIGTYHVTITFKGNYSGTVTKSFTIVPKGTDISRLTARSRGFDIKLKKQSGKISGYEIQYAVNRKFTGSKKKILNKKSKITAAIKKLKAKKKYFVRVRTYKTVKGKKYFSEWSKVKKVKTK